MSPTTLQEITIDDRRFALEDALCLLIALSAAREIEAVEQFAQGEWCILVPLLVAYPKFCAHGSLDESKNVVRESMKRIRPKARRLGLDIKSIVGAGYVLFPMRRG